MNATTPRLLKPLPLLLILTMSSGCRPTESTPPKNAASSLDKQIDPSLGQGYVTGRYGKVKVYYKKTKHGLRVEGDMLFPPQAISDEAEHGFHAVGVTNIGYLWPQGRIPYHFNITDHQAREVGISSASEFQNHMTRSNAYLGKS